MPSLSPSKEINKTVSSLTVESFQVHLFLWYLVGLFFFIIYTFDCTRFYYLYALTTSIARAGCQQIVIKKRICPESACIWNVRLGLPSQQHRWSPSSKGNFHRKRLSENLHSLQLHWDAAHLCLPRQKKNLLRSESQQKTPIGNVIYEVVG